MAKVFHQVNNDTVQFEDVEASQTFAYRGTVYMKLDSIFPNSQCNANAVRLTQAKEGVEKAFRKRFVTFPNSTEVGPANEYVIAHESRVEPIEG